MMLSSPYVKPQLWFSSSTERPAWLQNDLNAFNHKYDYGKIKIDYYKKRRQNARTK